MGPLRLFLALSVMFSHIGSIGWIPTVPAGFAVYSFFIMSGFYITLGLNERYKSATDNVEFYVGRALRLWPAYLFSILILIPTGMFEYTFNLIMQMPFLMKAVALFSNTFMLGSDLLLHMSAVDGHIKFSEYGIDPAHNGASTILNIPVWTLSIEIMFYLVAPFIVRSLKRSVIYFSIGVVYLVLTKHFSSALPFPVRTDLYFPGPSFYFGLGVMAYWLPKVLGKNLAVGVASYAAILAAILLCSILPLGLTLSFFALTVLCRPVFDKTRNSRLDQWFGDLSYPIYITHIPITIIVRWLGWFEATPMSYFASIIVGTIFVVYVIEKPIEKYRAIWRKKRLAAKHPSALEVA